MKKQFVTYEIALKLKELGFDEPCLAKYVKYNENEEIKLYPQSQNFFKGTGFDICQNSNYNVFENCTAPLWQQAFDWFKEEHNLFCVIHVHREGYSFNIHRLDKKDKEKELLFSTILSSISSGLYIKDYNEARLEALKKLIEL